MTELWMKSNVAEADEIEKGARRYIIRDSKYKCTQGDQFTLHPYRDGKQFPHKVEKRKFRITVIDTDERITKGFKIIGFEVM